MSFPIAVQVYSVRHAAKEDLAGTLQKIKDMGYDGVEFAGLYDHSPAEVKQMCQRIGLVPISAHVSFSDMAADPEGVLSQYKEIGCSYVAIPAVGPEYRPGAEKFGELMQLAAKIGKAAKALGMQLLYHNHDFEFTKVDGKYGLDVLYETVPADLLKTELDVCWVNVGGENPAAYIRKYAGRTPVVHLKDFVGEKTANMYELIGVKTEAAKQTEAFEFRPVGMGKNDLPAILQAAKESGAEWVVVEQDKPSLGMTELESIEKSIQYLKTINH